VTLDAKGLSADRIADGRAWGWLRLSYLATPAYFAGLALAFFAQSSQQTVISLPPTFTWIPLSLISQSHTGHFFVFIAYLLGFEVTIRVTAILRARS
jgi:hypothetical protein